MLDVLEEHVVVLSSQDDADITFTAGNAEQDGGTGVHNLVLRVVGLAEGLSSVGGHCIASGLTGLSVGIVPYIIQI